MENWQLKPCKDINRILKIRSDLDDFDKLHFPMLLTVSHRYTSSDDILFPEPATLAFITNLEENFLLDFEHGVYAAQDIDTGIIDTHIYVNDYKKSIFEIIKFLNKDPRLHFEFRVTPDPSWDIVKELSQKA